MAIESPSLVARSRDYLDHSPARGDRVRLRWAVMLAFLFGLGQTADAMICVQERIELDRIQGIVIDVDEQMLIPGVTLKLVHRGGDYEQVRVSDEEGFFAFTTVPEGKYLLEASLPGFETTGATVRVRKGTNAGEVLIVGLALLGFEQCGECKMVSPRRARRLQQELAPEVDRRRDRQ